MLYRSFTDLGGWGGGSASIAKRKQSMANYYRITVERTVAACERVGSCGLRLLVAGGRVMGGGV
jgi:hypothetical protein